MKTKTNLLSQQGAVELQGVASVRLSVNGVLGDRGVQVECMIYATFGNVKPWLGRLRPHHEGPGVLVTVFSLGDAPQIEILVENDHVEAAAIEAARKPESRTAREALLKRAVTAAMKQHFIGKKGEAS